MKENCPNKPCNYCKDLFKLKGWPLSFWCLQESPPRTVYYLADIYPNEPIQENLPKKSEEEK